MNEERQKKKQATVICNDSKSAMNASASSASINQKERQPLKEHFDELTIQPKSLVSKSAEGMGKDEGKIMRKKEPTPIADIISHFDQSSKFIQEEAQPKSVFRNEISGEKVLQLSKKLFNGNNNQLNVRKTPEQSKSVQGSSKADGKILSPTADIISNFFKINEERIQEEVRQKALRDELLGQDAVRKEMLQQAVLRQKALLQKTLSVSNNLSPGLENKDNFQIKNS